MKSVLLSISVLFISCCYSGVKCELIPLTRDLGNVTLFSASGNDISHGLKYCSSQTPSTVKEAVRYIGQGLDERLLEQTTNIKNYLLIVPGFKNVFIDVVTFFENKWQLNDKSPLIKNAQEKGVYINKFELIRFILEQAYREKREGSIDMLFEKKYAFFINNDRLVELEELQSPCEPMKYEFHQKHVFKTKKGLIRIAYINECKDVYVYLFEYGWVLLKGLDMTKID